MLRPFENLPDKFVGKVILLDIDGTLTPDYNYNFTPAVIAKLQSLQKSNTVYLCTNSRDITRRSKLEQLLKARIINGRYKKPNKKIVTEVPASQVDVVIGDKFLTDFWFAKRIGAECILTARKLSGQERWFIKLLNLFDNVMKKIYLFFTHEKL